MCAGNKEGRKPSLEAQKPTRTDLLHMLLLEKVKLPSTVTSMVTTM